MSGVVVAVAVAVAAVVAAAANFVSDIGDGAIAVVTSIVPTPDATR